MAVAIGVTDSNIMLFPPFIPCPPPELAVAPAPTVIVYVAPEVIPDIVFDKNPPPPPPPPRPSKPPPPAFPPLPPPATTKYSAVGVMDTYVSIVGILAVLKLRIEYLFNVILLIIFKT
jgi:hypothetical protein